jgi:hypothetical protein
MDVRSASMFICNKTENENNLSSFNLKPFFKKFNQTPDIMNCSNDKSCAGHPLTATTFFSFIK